MLELNDESKIIKN